MPEDEFDDGFPFQLYVREARRIEGRATFTEHDARTAEGLSRAPVAAESVAVAEYPMDSHDCRPVRRPGSLAEGHFFLPEVTVPSQVSHGTMLPRGLDDLIVPVPLSASHVGFGGIRLEPTCLHPGEAAGTAVSQASEHETTPGELETRALQRRLAGRGHTLTWFHDVDATADADWAAAVQYLGTRGFFRSYRARPDEPLDGETARAWAATAGALATGDVVSHRAGAGAPPGAGGVTRHRQGLRRGADRCVRARRGGRRPRRGGGSV